MSQAIRRVTFPVLLALGASLSCDSEGRESTAAVAAVPAQLAVATQPTGAISGALLTTQPIIEVRDAEQRPVSGVDAEVTAELAQGGGTLGGTRTVPAVNGVAAFSDLQVIGSGSHTLRFTSRGLEPVMSAAITISPADVTPSALGIRTEPANAVSGLPFGTRPVIEVRDTSGNAVASSNLAISAAIAAGTGTLAGTTTVSASNGIATFSDLRINGSGAHALTFTAAGVAAATSATVEVVQNPATLVIGTQPSGATTGSPLAAQPVVRIVDNAGLLIGNATMVVTAAVATGGGALSGTRSVAAVGGVATFTDLRIDGQGPHVLSFTASNLPAVSSGSFTVTTGPAAKLAVATHPAGAVTAVAFAIQPIVHLRDAGNTLVTTSTAPVTAAIAEGTGTLGGTVTVNAVNGVATFSDLSITGTGPHRIVFSSGALTTATTNAFTVAATAPPASALAITAQPAGAMSGVPIATQPVIQVRDANNVVVAASTAPITASIAGGSGTLGGTTTVNAVNGVASFTDLAITGSGTHTIAFSSPGLTGVTSGVFVVSGPATQLAIDVQPQGASSGTPFTTQPVIVLRDAAGNTAIGSAVPVTVTVASGNGTLAGTTTVNATSGIAIFMDLSLTGSGAHTLVFTSPGLTPATSASVMVGGGAATQLAIAMQPTVGLSGEILSPFPSVQVRDAANGVVTSSTAAVTAAIAGGSGSLSGSTTVNAVNGIATFTNLKVTGTGLHSLAFNSGTLTPATTNSFEIFPANSGDSQEPPTFQLLTEREFAAKVEQNWQDRGDAAFSIQNEPTAPRPDDMVGQALFPAGFGAGSGPINTYYSVGGNRTRLYVRFYFRVSPNWQGQEASINKVLFLWHGTGPHVFLNLAGVGSGPLHFRVNTQFPSSIQTKDFSFGQPSFGGNPIECVRGTWYLWEVLLESNSSANTPDGRIRSWVNGTLFTDSNIEVPAQTQFPGLIMWETGQSPYWTQVSWNPTWGGAGGSVANTMFQQIDFIRVSANP